MLTLGKKTGLAITIGLLSVICCVGIVQAGTGYGLSNILTINNRDSITVGATNNWDGTVTVTWPDKGGIQLIRQESSNPSNWTGWSRTGTTYKDTYQLSELKTAGGVCKKYIYILKDLSGIELGRSSEVMPDIVVVLVRGYSPFGKAIVPDAWKTTDTTLINRGLVPDVQQWFTERGVTCWDASGVLNGKNSVSWNADTLKTYISDKRVGDYSDAKINLLGHSMGGLISRKYASDNLENDIVLNIFCTQTPHTGSPLATIRGLWPDNEATYCLLPAYSIIFNNSVNIGDTKLYATYSANPVSICYDPGLIVASAIILGLSGAHAQMYFPNTSDGAVPTVSAMGKLWLIDQIHIDQLYDSHLDHSSCNKHPNTLNKIMEWLGYPQAAPSPSPEMQIHFAGEGEPKTPLYFVAGFQGQFNNTSPVAKTIKISNTQRAYLRAVVSDPNCSFTLTRPDTSVIDPVVAVNDPNITYHSEDGVMAYEIQEPMPGLWTMNLTTTVTAPNWVQYGLTAFEDQQIFLSVDSYSEWINTGQSVLLKAALSDNAGAITGATVSGVVSLPNTTTQNIILYDDGTNGDPNANDGTYSYMFSSTSLEGRYNVDVNATGTISGSNFERTATTSFTASVANIIVNGAITDQGIDTNGNGKYDLLRLTVPVNVLAAKEYRLTVSLTDSQGKLISLINSGLVHLALDANVISVDTLAKDIVKHNVDGPYTFKSIQISDGNTGIVVASAIDHNTVTYQIAQFEPLDSDGDGLSDVMELSIDTDPNKVDTDEDGATDYQEISVDGDSTSYNPLTDSNPLVQDTDDDGMPDGYEIRYGLNSLIDDTTEDLDGDELTNNQEYNLHTRPDKIDTDDDGRNDKWEIDHSANPLVYESYTKQIGDVDLDAMVGISDLNIMASQWLHTPGNPSADIAPTPVDGQVNLLDLTLLAKYWQKSIE